MRGVQFPRYNSTGNRLVLVARDRSPRPVTCQELVDINTVAVGDTFANVAVLRLPRWADIGAIDVTGTRALWDSSVMTPRPASRRSARTTSARLSPQI